MRRSPAAGTSKQAVGAAYTLTGAVLGLALLGFFLDRQFNTAPMLLISGLILGAGIGLYDLWKAMFPPGGED